MKILIIIWAVGVEFTLACMIVSWYGCYAVIKEARTKKQNKFAIFCYYTFKKYGWDNKLIYDLVYRPTKAIVMAMQAWFWPIYAAALILRL